MTKKEKILEFLCEILEKKEKKLEELISEFSKEEDRKRAIELDKELNNIIIDIYTVMKKVEKLREEIKNG
jgi:DNA phosphorothioation-dependent restriction protein DptG